MTKLAAWHVQTSMSSPFLCFAAPHSSSNSQGYSLNREPGHFKHSLLLASSFGSCRQQRFVYTKAMQREEPGPGQESVWDYPRPPKLEPVPERITVELGGKVCQPASGCQPVHVSVYCASLC